MQKIDLSFLQGGEARRSEVAEKLDPIDTEIKSGRFFRGHIAMGRLGISGWLCEGCKSFAEFAP